MTKIRTNFKPIVIQDTAPELSSDGGLLLLEKLNERDKLTARFASQLADGRFDCIHTAEKMIAQRVFGIALGWEDCNDFDALRRDPLYKLALGSVPASQPTLSRFENSVEAGDLERMSEVLVDVFVGRHLAKPPKRIILDIDATDDPTHGQQEFDFFSKLYDCHCFVPLLVYGECDGSPMEILAAVLRAGSGHPGKDAPALVRRIAGQIKDALPMCQIVVRADGGFNSPELFQTCEELDLKYLVCIPKNEVLEREAAQYMALARAKRDETDEAARFYGEFKYSAGSWKKIMRRVIVKAEALPARAKARDPKVKDNARFVATNMEGEPDEIYALYCRRGECENQIKEMKLNLASGRTSCHRFTANAFRLMLAAIAFALLGLVRECLAEHALARCTLGTIRVKFLKIATVVTETTRRILIQLPQGHPHVPFLMKLLAK